MIMMLNKFLILNKDHLKIITVDIKHKGILMLKQSKKMSKPSSPSYPCDGNLKVNLC